MRKLSFIFFACAAFTFIACEDETVPDTKAPTVVINSPSEGDEFSQQDEILFESAVTDDSELETVTVSITPPSGEAQLIHTADKESFTSNGREVSVNRTFPLSLAGKLAAGSYILTVHASDIHGNTTNEDVRVKIKESDTGAPVITFSKPTEGSVFDQEAVIPIEAAVADGSGISTVTIRITPPNGPARVIHSKEFTEENVTEAHLTQEITLGADSEPGDYVVTLEAADIHGNMGSKSTSIRLRERDTTAPTLTISNPTESKEFNSDDVISIEARATDNTELGSYTISIAPPADEAQLVHSKEFSAKSTEGNIWETIPLEEGAAAGTYTITIEVTDASGNSIDRSVAVSVKVPDAEAPTITVSAPTEGAVFTTEESIPVDVSLSDDTGLASASISITPPGGQASEVYSEAFTGKPAEGSLNQTVSLGDTPATGNYIITIKVTDSEGHTRDKNVNVVVREQDNTAPTVTLSSPAAGTEFYANEPIPFKAAAVDNAALQEVSVWVISPAGEARLVHTEDPQNFFNNDTEATVDEAIGLGTENAAAGTYTLRIRAIDVAGNTTEEEVTVNILEADTSAPTITVNSPEAGTSYVPGDEVPLDAIVEDNRKLAEIRVVVMLENSVSVYDNTITEFNSDTRHQLLDTLAIPLDAPLGTYYVTITATDAAGNTTEEELTFQIIEEE